MSEYETAETEAVETEAVGNESVEVPADEVAVEVAAVEEAPAVEVPADEAAEDEIDEPQDARRDEAQNAAGEAHALTENAPEAAQKVADGDDAGATPRRGGRGRRVTRPIATPEPLDVLAELGSVRAETAPDAEVRTPAAVGAVASELDRIVFAAPDRPRESDTVEDQPDADDAEAVPVDGEPDAEADLGPRLPVTALLFQAPEPVARPRRRRAQAPAGPPVVAVIEGGEPGAEASSAEVAPAGGASADEGAGESTPGTERAPEVDAAEAEEPGEGLEPGEDEGESTGTSGAARRRRRRGGRGRRRPASGESGGESRAGADGETGDGESEPGEPAEDAEAEDAGLPEPEDEAAEDGEDNGAGTSRRRRRRRRGTRTGEAEAPAAPVSPNRTDEVTALKGSTRLEAKRQRRREGRDAGRRRTVVTEAEFLARRESVERAMVVRERDGRTQIAVLEDGVLVEHFVARRTQTSMVGGVYLGRVQNVLPSMEAAFVDLGKGRNAVLYAGEVNWDAAGMEGQPRRIEQALSAGDSVLVQVTKDPIGHKGARLTSQITLAGRYLVLVPSGAMTGISRKLPDTERARLKKVLKEIVPESAGVIVRTAAEGASEEELRLDVARLQAQWAEIEKKAKTASAPAVLSSEPDLAIRVVRDVFNEDIGSVTISGDEAWRAISDYVGGVAPDLAPRLHRWTAAQDVFSAHRIDEQLAKGLDRKVWLPSGGSLVIDRTEAMTVIDVNTGKFTGTGGTLEETVTRNNLEAAEEIVRQLRLRDIGGIIVIDFIDMVLESNRDLVLRRLVECLGRDRTRHQVAEVTSLGLVQMTRKRVGQGLIEAFSETCECCNGRGYVIHTEPVEKSPNGGGETGSDDAGARGGASASRRRGRRGGDGGSGGSGVSGAATTQGAARASGGRPAADADAVAAREAVKATLATIAAAAAHAHEEQAHEEHAQHEVDAGAERGTTIAVDGASRGEEPEAAEAEVIDFDALRAGDAPAGAFPHVVAAAADAEHEAAASVEDAAEAVAETLDFDEISGRTTGAESAPGEDPGGEALQD